MSSNLSGELLSPRDVCGMFSGVVVLLGMLWEVVRKLK
jgi:hypothetical protein